MPEGNAERPGRKRLLADEPAPPSHFVAADALPWEATKFPGIETKLLYHDAASGMSTMLFRMAPGAVVPLHEHTAVEQTWMLEGSLVDEDGACLPGQFVWRPAGSTHVAHAPDGAVFLSVLLRPNHFAEGQRFFTEDRPD